MAIAFNGNPQEGDIFEISPERKLIFSGGRWKLHTNNVPFSLQIVLPDSPVIVSEEEPSVDVDTIFWYRSSDDMLHFKAEGIENMRYWQRVPDHQPIISFVEPSISVPQTLWLKPHTGQLFYKAVDGEVIEWREMLMKLVPPVESEEEPALDGIQSMWFKPSTGALHWRRYVDEVPQWVTIFTPQAEVDVAAIVAQAIAGATTAVLGQVFDANNKIAPERLYSYVDDVVEFNSVAEMQATAGEKGKIYVVVTGETTWDDYRWTGSVYFKLPKSPGSTNDVPEGLGNLYFTADRARAAVTEITGNSGTATKLATERKISITGGATGEAYFDGSKDINIDVIVPPPQASNIPNDVSASIFGKPADAEYLIRLSPAVRAFVLDGTGSASCGTAASAEAVLTVYKNGVSVGTITFSAGATLGTLSIPSAVTIAIGDRISIVCPATADATLADIDVTLKGLVS